jgi:FG-GAP-like repeat
MAGLRRWFLVSVSAGLVAVGACGDSGQNNTTGSSSGTGGAGASASTGGAGGLGGSAGGLGFGGNGDCTQDGAPCDGGICAGGECCEAELACEATCCDTGQVCSFQLCQTPGSTCFDASDCQADEYCDLSLGNNDPGTGGGGGGCLGGVGQLEGKCLPRPPVCGNGEEPGDPPTCLESCQYQPPSTTFSPVLKYEWGGQVVAPFATDVMASPIVLSLDDDDCDGTITDRDIPEVIFATFSNGSYEANGVLHAISVVGGQVVDKWATAAGAVNPTKQIAGGDFSTDPGNEVVACATNGTVVAFRGEDGTPLPGWTPTAMACVMPSIADLDGDGSPEVIVEGGILDGTTGQLKHAFSEPLDSSFVISDIDGDGALDVVTGSQAFDASGQLFVDTNLANTSSFPNDSDWKSPWPAVADFDLDGTAEVVVMHNLTHELSIWRYDATAPQNFVVVRPPVDINGTLPVSNCPPGSWGNTHGGGPPTIADFNGDSVPDVALAGGIGYAVFDGLALLDPMVPGPSTFLWVSPTFDCSSASTGSTVFDFDGDGVAEVIYSDQRELRVYEGPTGNVLWQTCNTTATLIENPVVADVDNDGHADIIAVSNAYAQTCVDENNVTTRQAGIRIFSSANDDWVRTRRVWNEHAYHITNVGEDGSIPTVEAANYLANGLNNFRQNKQPGSEFAAPDAIVSLAPLCGGEYGLVATVRNVGEASLPAGVPVGFYAGTPLNGTLLGTEMTQQTLYSVETEAVVLLLPNAPPDVLNGTTPVYAVVDDTTVPHPEWTECRTDNNVSEPVSGECPTPD